jgi:hypothetical protein
MRATITNRENLSYPNFYRPCQFAAAWLYLPTDTPALKALPTDTPALKAWGSVRFKNKMGMPSSGKQHN